MTENPPHTTALYRIEGGAHNSPHYAKRLLQFSENKFIFLPVRAYICIYVIYVYKYMLSIYLYVYIYIYIYVYNDPQMPLPTPKSILFFFFFFTQRNIFQILHYIKPKSDCIYHAPIDLEQQTDTVRLLYQINQSVHGKYNLI